MHMYITSKTGTRVTKLKIMRVKFKPCYYMYADHIHEPTYR